MIQTLAITIAIEGVICLAYSVWRKKPIWLILFISLLGNIVTQSLLWVVLTLFFQHYVVTLLIAETLIWLMEAAFLYCFRLNRLSIQDAVFLSFMMNLSSFGIGLWLPL